STNFSPSAASKPGPSAKTSVTAFLPSRSMISGILSRTSFAIFSTSFWHMRENDVHEFRVSEAQILRPCPETPFRDVRAVHIPVDAESEARLTVTHQLQAYRRTVRFRRKHKVEPFAFTSWATVRNVNADRFRFLFNIRSCHMFLL